MTERRLAFIDVDENHLVVWLKQDRVQLCVVDSRPELEADQLRAFASVLFAVYVGGPLAVRLDAVRAKIGAVRDRLAAAHSADDLLAALDGSLCAIEDVKQAMTGAARAIAPNPEPAPPAAEVVAPVSRPRKPGRSKRSREGGGALGWAVGSRGEAAVTGGDGASPGGHGASAAAPDRHAPPSSISM